MYKLRLRPYLIRPDTLSSSKTSDTAAHLHIFMGGVHLPQAGADVGHHPAENLAAEDHARTPHAEVLAWLKGQFAQLLCSAQTRLTQVQWLTAVQRAQEKLQPFT